MERVWHRIGLILKPRKVQKTAVVNAVGASVLLALLLFWGAVQAMHGIAPQHSPRVWFGFASAFSFIVVGWGLHKMSRAAALAGVVLFVTWIAFHMPGLLVKVSQDGDRFSLIWVGLDLLFLWFYVIAVRATLAYRRPLILRPQNPASRPS